MKKFIFIIIIIIFAFCSCGREPGNIPVQEQVLNQTPEIHLPIEPNGPSEETAPAPAEIPRYNDYNISLEIEPETRMVTGISRIQYTNRSGSPLETVVIRVYLNAFNENTSTLPYFPAFERRIFKYGKDYGYMNIHHVSLDNEEVSYKLEGTVLNIILAEPISPGQTVQLKLQFDAYVPKIAHRTGANDNAMWCGMFLPVLAVCGEQGWHTEPYYPAGDPFLLETANFSVDITAPLRYEIAGSGIKKETIMEDKKVTNFTAHMVRDFAFSVSENYKEAETVTESGNIVIYLYYYTETLDVNHILDAAKRSMEYFEKRVGAYPYVNVCIAETDMFVNGMEFSKIIFMDSVYMQNGGSMPSLTHELGHQWFYNVVGNDQIGEAWLDEGLTMYIQEGFFYPEEEALRVKMENDYANLQNRSIWALTESTAEFTDWTDYYQTHYTKAKLMMFALNRLMGHDVFWNFINRYYQTFSFRIAAAADFMQIAEDAYGSSLNDFFREWVYSVGLPALP